MPELDGRRNATSTTRPGEAHDVAADSSLTARLASSLDVAQLAGRSPCARCPQRLWRWLLRHGRSGGACQRRSSRARQPPYFRTRDQPRLALLRYIQSFYNPPRGHSSLDIADQTALFVGARKLDVSSDLVRLFRLSRTDRTPRSSRQRDHEPRPQPRTLVLGVDAAAVRLDDRARDRKSDPAASGRPRPRGVCAEEPLEHPLEHPLEVCLRRPYGGQVKTPGRPWSRFGQDKIRSRLCGSVARGETTTPTPFGRTRVVPRRRSPPTPGSPNVSKHLGVLLDVVDIPTAPAVTRP